MPTTAVAGPSSRRCHQYLVLRSPVAEQLQQVVRGSDQVPFAVDLFQAPQQKPPQAPGFLDLPVHRFHDRHRHWTGALRSLQHELEGVDSLGLRFLSALPPGHFLRKPSLVQCLALEGPLASRCTAQTWVQILKYLSGMRESAPTSIPKKSPAAFRSASLTPAT
jgi:hypothetical protein